MDAGLSAEEQARAVADRPAPPPKASRVSSQDLLGGLRRLTIDHEGMEYTLHLTRQNKLLLTK